MRKLIKRRMSDQRGVTALEYGLVAAVLVGVVVLGFASLGVALSTQFATIGASL